MSAANLHRVKRAAREAEGYLELGLPQSALNALARIDDPGSFRGTFLYLKGEALRESDRFEEAIGPLIEATDVAPSDLRIPLALGWCYKRIDRLELAIKALEDALELRPEEPLLWYNLACYASLARRKARALYFLARALDLDASYRELIPRRATSIRSARTKNSRRW